MSLGMILRRGVIAAGAFLLAAPALAQRAPEPIRIGAVLSVTGPASFLGDPEDKTLRLYVNRINQAGGVNGRPLQLIIYDDAGDANRARTFATRLVEDDRVVAMVGGTTTGTTLAMRPVFEDARIPFISLAGGIEIIDPVQPFTFKTPHTDRMACEKIFADIRARGLTRVGMISGTDGFGQSMRGQCVRVAGAAGITIVAEESYGPRDSDMTPQLTRLRNAQGIEAVVNPGFGQGPAIVTRGYHQLGIRLPLYQSHGVASREFINLATPAAAEGVRLPAAALLIAEQLPTSDPQHQVVLDYKAAFEREFNQPVSTFGGHAYDGLMILVEAMRRANSTDGTRLRDAIRATRGFVGTGGIVNMSATDHMGLDLSAFRMVEIRNGDWALLGN
ncbi:ABC transporter substrate-binding protein [Falsiroseomonas stagni]|uniref:Amino acid/amide ABC transporter substrate-binding protein, HAAT family (TC 3.A.1.4.-) n=1 Tax=Falsiroseomonas stagni DSM 19981 TaxID=1123062 RepID=A0A1I4E7U0_9PROT|nr:ABC transporter substrate-binding protein [Falsiroseomonas stagni]SFL01868.1 amino acid/amide ABC transporter substrate-binding protein, HAAT family (TC 3.A.1.4.-) [Falsiroseomonas stagni DSM 19981]